MDRANDAALGALVRGLMVEYPDLLVLTEAQQVEDAPHGAVMVLVARTEDALWLNLARPIFADRALKVVLWSKAEVTAELLRRAPDFFDWIARRFECPAAAPAFAVAGMRAALRARAWAVAFKGPGLDEVFAASFPKRSLVRASVSLNDASLLSVVKTAGPAWIGWSHVLDEQGANRLKALLVGARRRGRNVIDHAMVEVPGAWPVSGAMVKLEGAGVPARLSAMLDLEPEAIGMAAELLSSGMSLAEVEGAVLRAGDPGAAVGKLVGDRRGIDPVLVAGYRAPGPMLRAFLFDPRVREAAAVLAGRVRRVLPPLTERIPAGEAGEKSSSG
ncbi:MAG: hypothetical protein U0359_13745 [Byssovorax sp.]